MLTTVQNLLRRTEEAIIVTLLSAMIVLSGTQILLRNLWDSGLSWADPLLRVLVLWVGMLGAMLATRQNKHIRIDLLSRYLPKQWTRYSVLVTDIFSSTVCAVLAWHSGRFVHYEWQDGVNVFSGIPAWVTELILPIGFAVISLRFALQAWLAFRGRLL